MPPMQIRPQSIRVKLASDNRQVSAGHNLGANRRAAGAWNDELPTPEVRRIAGGPASYVMEGHESGPLILYFHG